MCKQFDIFCRNLVLANEYRWPQISFICEVASTISLILLSKKTFDFYFFIPRINESPVQLSHWKRPSPVHQCLALMHWHVNTPKHCPRTQVTVDDANFDELRRRPIAYYAVKNRTKRQAINSILFGGLSSVELIIIFKLICNFCSIESFMSFFFCSFVMIVTDFGS